MTSTDSLEAAFKKVGKFALILFGVGMILIVVDIYVIAGYAFSKVASAPYSPFSITGEMASLLALLIGGFSCILVSGVIVTRIGIGVGKGAVSNRQILFAILSFSVFITFIGTSSVLIPHLTGSSTWLTSIGSLAIVSGVLLFVAPILYLRNSEVGKVIGSIVGIVAIGLLIAGGWQAERGIFSGLATDPFPSVVTSGTLGSSGYIIAGVAALIYPFVNNTRFSKSAHVIAMIGFILFGVEMAITTLTFVSDPLIWSIPGEALALMSVVIVAVIILAVSGFLTMASSGIGISIYSRKLLSTVAVSEKVDGQVMYCPQCGAKTEGDAAHCKNCGHKLKQ